MHLLGGGLQHEARTIFPDAPAEGQVGFQQRLAFDAPGLPV